MTTETLRHKLGMQATLGTTEKYSRDDAQLLRETLTAARALCEEHWNNDSGKVSRQSVRALEALLTKVGA